MPPVNYDKECCTMNRRRRKIKIIVVISVLCLSILFVTVKFGSINDVKYQTNTVVVIDKVSTSNFKISVQEIYEQENFWIEVKDENVWNLIQKDSKYFIVCSVDKNNSRTLLQIELFN